MSKTNIIHVLAAVFLTLYTTNVEGADLDALKTAFGDFMNVMHGIGGGFTPATIGAYNTCAERATTYEELIQCANTAYDAYLPFIGFSIPQTYQQYMDATNTLRAAILSATTGDPPNLRLIPIPDVRERYQRATNIKLKRDSDKSAARGRG